MEAYLLSGDAAHDAYFLSDTNVDPTNIGLIRSCAPRDIEHHLMAGKHCAERNFNSLAEVQGSPG